MLLCPLMLASHLRHLGCKLQQPITPSTKDVRAIIKLRHNGILVAGHLYKVDVHVRVDLLAVVRHKFRNVDKPRIARPSVTRIVALVSAIQAAVTCLHVTEDEDMIPLLFLFDGFVPEQPDTILCTLANLLAVCVDLLQLVEYRCMLAYAHVDQLIAKYSDIPIISPHTSQDAGEVSNHADLHGAHAGRRSSTCRSAIVTQ